MLTAIWKTCAGVQNDGLAAHSMRDNCSSCAPYWEQYPACPVCLVMVGRSNAAESGEKRKCPKCKKMVLVNPCDVSPVQLKAPATDWEKTTGLPYDEWQKRHSQMNDK